MNRARRLAQERSATLLATIAAAGASLCCIGPALGLAAGLTGAVSAFAWAAPLRLPLAGLTLWLLAFAWRRALRADRRRASCACDAEPSRRERAMLAVVTVAALALLAFPSYAERLYPEGRSGNEALAARPSEARAAIRVAITGMTCAGCVPHVEATLAAVEGVAAWEVVYERAEAVVRYDPERTTPEAIRQAVVSAGYGAELAGALP